MLLQVLWKHCNEDRVFIAQFNWKNIVFLNFVLNFRRNQYKNSRCYFLKHFYNFPSQKIDEFSISVIFVNGNIEVSQDVSKNAKAPLARDT